MNKTRTLKRKSSILLLLFSVMLLYPALCFGLNLAAVENEWFPPNRGSAIKMWGFVEDTGDCFPTPDNFQWKPGPVQTGIVDGKLSITLRNCLSEPISLIIPGLQTSMSPQTFIDDKGRTRVRAFTNEVPADNGQTLVTYTWKNIQAGTYLYMSGSHPAKQVPMGLYGAVTIGQHKDAAADTILLFSEIDPALHINAEATTPLNYKPKYFLINGESSALNTPPPIALTVRDTKVPLQLRFLNAGLMTHIPTIQGPHMLLFAEDGNPYPYPKEQYSVTLPAGKTIDALWSPETAQMYSLYDRRLSMTTNGLVGGGMIQNFNIKRFPWQMFAPAMATGRPNTP